MILDLIGTLALVLVFFTFFLFLSRYVPLGSLVHPSSPTSMRQRIKLLQEDHNWHAVDPGQFPHLPIDQYDTVRDFMLGSGFSFLGDFENVAFNERSKSSKTFIRYLLSSDGIVTLDCFAFKALRNSFTLTLGTEFSDGTFLVTTNGLGAYLLDGIPGITTLSFSPHESLQRMLTAHLSFLAELNQKQPERQPILLRTIDDVWLMEERWRVLRLKHLQSQLASMSLEL